MANPATGVLHIALIAGNDMHMQMHDGLPGCSPRIDPDIISVGPETLVEQRLDVVDEPHNGLLLLAARVKPGRHHPMRNHLRPGRTRSQETLAAFPCRVGRSISVIRPRKNGETPA